MIEVDEEAWSGIQRDLAWLRALENAGVDNWDGIDFAHDLYREEEARLRG